jgi:SAM-dependent methyltransferase
MAWGKVWEQEFLRHSWGKYPGEDIIRFVARNFYAAPDRSGIKLLEVGCGPGANLWYAAREGFAVYGVDGSPTAIQAAAARLDGECPGWSGALKVADIEHLPFPEMFFDGVLDSEAVFANPYENAAAIYHEMWRVTKPRGKLYSKTFAQGCFGEGTGKKAGHHAWFPSKGPLAGIEGDRFTRFTSYEEIPVLLRDWRNIQIGLITYSVGRIEDEQTVKEWVITAEKI